MFKKRIVEAYLSTDLEYVQLCILPLDWMEVAREESAVSYKFSGRFKPYIEELIEQKRVVGYP